MTEKLEVGWHRSLKWDDREAWSGMTEKLEVGWQRSCYQHSNCKPAQPEASYFSNSSSPKKAGSPEWECYKADKVGMQWHSTQSKRQVTCTEKVSNLLTCSSGSSPAGEKPCKHSTPVWLSIIHNCPIVVSCRVSSNTNKIPAKFQECLGETRPASSADWQSNSCLCNHGNRMFGGNKANFVCWLSVVLHYLTMTHFGLPVSYQHFQLQRFDHTLVILLR